MFNNLTTQVGWNFWTSTGALADARLGSVQRTLAEDRYLKSFKFDSLGDMLDSLKFSQ